MAPRTRKASDPLADLPSWAQKLAQAYYTKTVSTFLLHGAVRALQPLRPTEDRSHGPLKQFLTEELFGGRSHVLHYDRSSGIRAANPDSQKDFTRTLSAYDTLYGTEYAKVLPRDPGRALQILENYMRMRLADGQSLALIIDFAETLAPGGGVGSLSPEDPFPPATPGKWASGPQFLPRARSHLPLAEISGRLSRNPYVANIELPLPNEEERQDFVQVKLQGKRLASISEIPAPALAKMSAGLSRINLDRILTEAVEREVKITPELLKEKKKEIIQAECHGLLEFIEPSHTLDSVAGHAGAKQMLRQAASALKKGRIEGLPMGYLVSGPVGTGKTFL